MPFIAIAICIAAAPVTALAVMALTGLAAAWPALVAIAVTILAAAAFSLVWARDLDVLTVSVQRIEDDPDAVAATTVGPTLMEPLGLEIARLARRLAARTARIDQERRADTLILERLPDALIVLREDLTVSRRKRFSARIWRRCCGIRNCARLSTSLLPTAKRRRPTCRSPAPSRVNCARR